jgi:Na+-driven multidrug efflux pump
MVAMEAQAVHPMGLLVLVLEDHLMGLPGSLRPLGLVVALAPQVWSTLFTQDALVVESAASYFAWAGPFYGFFGLGLSLYFSSLGAGKAVGPVMAGGVRLAVVAVGGSLLAYWHAPAWMIFALVGAGMAVYGLCTVLVVKATSWGPATAKT